MINIKVDPKMRTATMKQALQQSFSMSTVIEQAIEELLKDRGIDWRAEDRRVGIHAR